MVERNKCVKNPHLHATVYTRETVHACMSIHAFNKSGRHLEFLIYDVIR